jgi:hypothetical protein
VAAASPRDTADTDRLPATTTFPSRPRARTHEFRARTICARNYLVWRARSGRASTLIVVVLRRG